MDDSVYNTLELKQKSWLSLSELPSAVLASIDLYLCLHDDSSVDKRLQTQARRLWLQRACRAVEAEPLCLKDWIPPDQHHLLDLSFAQKPLPPLRTLTSAQLLALKFTEVEGEVLEDALEELQKRRRNALIERAKVEREKGAVRGSPLDRQPIPPRIETAGSLATSQSVERAPKARVVGSTQSPVERSSNFKQAPIEVQDALRRLRDATQPVRPPMSAIARLNAKIIPAPIKASQQVVKRAAAAPTIKAQNTPRPVVKPEPQEADLSQLRTAQFTVKPKQEEEPTLDDTSTGSASPKGAWESPEPVYEAASPWGSPEPLQAASPWGSPVPLHATAIPGNNALPDSRPQELLPFVPPGAPPSLMPPSPEWNTFKDPPMTRRQPPVRRRPAQLAPNPNLIALALSGLHSTSTTNVYQAPDRNTPIYPPDTRPSRLHLPSTDHADQYQAIIDRYQFQTSAPSCTNPLVLSSVHRALLSPQIQSNNLPALPYRSALVPRPRPITSNYVAPSAKSPTLGTELVRRQDAGHPPMPNRVDIPRRMSSMQPPQYPPPDYQASQGFMKMPQQQPPKVQSLQPNQQAPPTTLGKRNRPEVQHPHPSLPPRPAPALRLREASWTARPPHGSAEPVRIV